MTDDEVTACSLIPVLVTGIRRRRVRAVNDSFTFARASPAPKDLGALDSCDEHRNEGGVWGSRLYTQCFHSSSRKLGCCADISHPPVIGGKIPISRALPIGSSCSACSWSSATRITFSY
ncbi:hypothetical protein CWR43_28770 [Rhizobium sullae]|uniref:Uncharacterized protein n=1 Tax=Rhizobium sullae TaxID=50338 RepID=A0A2N0D358_RHISU|nr:hypothetical protein CWR43_28770 [Rhizobium sullae]